MTRMVTALLDRMVFVACIVACGAVPGFIAQYRQQVIGRLAQARADLEPFIGIAKRRHGDDLQRLIDHHLASGDVTFVREGQAISSMADSLALLSEAQAALDGPLASQAWYLLGHMDPAIAASTWNAFEPAFALTTEGIVFALVAGVSLWALLVGTSRTLRALAASLGSSRNAAG